MRPVRTQTGIPATRIRRKTLELEFQIQLHAAGGLGLYAASEEWRGNHADVREVVLVVEDVEGIQGHRQRHRFFTRFREDEIMCSIEIQVEETGAVKAVPRHSSRAVVHNAIVIVVISSGLVDWLS